MLLVRIRHAGTYLAVAAVILILTRAQYWIVDALVAGFLAFLTVFDSLRGIRYIEVVKRPEPNRSRVYHYAMLLGSKALGTRTVYMGNAFEKEFISLLVQGESTADILAVLQNNPPASAPMSVRDV